METLHCVRASDGDWNLKTPTHSGRKWVMCNEDSNDWWELTRATEIKIFLVDKPTDGAYKCKNPGGNFYIQDELTGKWHDYGLYSLLHDAVDKMPAKIFYMGVQVIK